MCNPTGIAGEGSAAGMGEVDVEISGGGLGVTIDQESQQWEDQGVEWRRMKTS